MDLQLAVREVRRGWVEQLHRDHGGAAAWALAHGLPQHAADRLRGRLLEPAA